MMHKMQSFATAEFITYNKITNNKTLYAGNGQTMEVAVDTRPRLLEVAGNE